MQNGLVVALQTEERQLVAELRATPTFRKLDAIRRLIALYGSGAGPSVVEAGPALLSTTPTPANSTEPSLVKEVDEPLPQTVREGNKAVSVVRAALAAVTG